MRLRRPLRQGNSGDSSGSGWRRRRRLVAGFCALVLVGIAANFAASQLIKGKVAQAAQLLHGSTDVDLGGAPALVDLVTGQVPDVHINSSNASLCRFSGLAVSADLTDVSGNTGQLSVASTHATVSISTAALSHALGGQLPTAAIKPNPAGNVIDIGSGSAGLLQLRVRPVLTGSTLSVMLLGATVLGRPASPTLLSRLRRRIHFSRPLTNLPLDLTPSHVSVTSTGIVISMSGGSWQGSVSPGSTGGPCA